MDELRRRIQEAGGLVTLTMMAQRWGVSKSRAFELSKHPDFPEPVTRLGVSDVWVAGEVDAWRAARMERQGTP